MAWHDIMQAEDVQIRESPQESARFGCSVERLTVPLDAEDSFIAVREAVRGSTADVIVLRYPAQYIDWFARLIKLGRTAILADSLAYWRLRAGEGRAPEPSKNLRTTGVVCPATTKALIADIFAGYGNHYLANPLFEVRDALAGYQEWAQRSVDEGRCLALWEREVDDALGLATLDETGLRTEILLAGIVGKAQGRGLYSHLLKGVEDATLARGAAEVVISTQGHNTRVQRAWARYGFEPMWTLITVHLVRPALLTTV
ncbi:GNAT family N-acetyltransferase [Planotetraspora mira]|uniref:N-acetyltransferase domain-containing protein n=1 Tax=Planotetraspora mira TaxID=58121 RepID=A0A8J3TMJ1_9ACTN|nr:GNAT family N-acetyltransferase [Planotetraspora mira]GII27284.1 hypothetical protein Pmi06nite_07260 [Planotetraspora mira]